MARGVDFEGANLTLTAAPGDEGSVLPLRVYRGEGVFVSCWDLDADELAEIARTGKVWLSVSGGRTAPPVFVSGRRYAVLKDRG